MAGVVRTGTSGWVYASWRGILYESGVPQRRWLERYAETFDSVELNASFYRMPSFEQFASWRTRTPRGFCFAVKGSQLITHRRRLRGVDSALAAFFAALEGLGAKAGVVLWQLPPTLERDESLLGAFLELLPRRRAPRHALEFRHPSWYARSVYARLEARGVALVHPDSAARPEMHRETVRHTADFAYLRFHCGAARGGRYAPEQLEAWARRIVRWQRERDVYAYFNNDWNGYAVRDALRLGELVEGRARASAPTRDRAPPGGRPGARGAR